MRAGEEKEIRVKSRLPGSSFSPETKTTFSLPARFSPLKHDENEQTLLVLANLHTVLHIERGRLYHPQHQWGRYRVRGAQERKKKHMGKSFSYFFAPFFFSFCTSRARANTLRQRRVYLVPLSLSVTSCLSIYLISGSMGKQFLSQRFGMLSMVCRGRRWRSRHEFLFMGGAYNLFSHMINSCILRVNIW